MVKTHHLFMSECAFKTFINILYTTKEAQPLYTSNLKQDSEFTTILFCLFTFQLFSTKDLVSLITTTCRQNFSISLYINLSHAPMPTVRTGRGKMEYLLSLVRNWRGMTEYCGHFPKSLRCSPGRCNAWTALYRKQAQRALPNTFMHADLKNL